MFLVYYQYPRTLAHAPHHRLIAMLQYSLSSDMGRLNLVHVLTSLSKSAVVNMGKCVPNAAELILHDGTLHC